MDEYRYIHIPEVTADEDVDRDVEIAEQEERRSELRRKSARQLIEDRQDEEDEWL